MEKLHAAAQVPNAFKDLIAIAADQMHLPESAIERDHYMDGRRGC